MSLATEFLLAQAEGRAGNIKKSFDLFLGLAQRGHTTAQQNIAYMYTKGIGAPKDDAEAFRWYREAAHGGDAVSQYNFGLMLLKGEACDEDPAAAFKWIQLAAGSGLAEAQASLVLAYLEGTGVQKDVQRGIDLLWKFCDEGNAEAQFMAGEFFARKQEWQQAATWWLNAAERDHHTAQFEVGKLFLIGMGVKCDLTLAFKYLLLASYANVPGADQAMEQLSKVISATQVEAAQNLLGKWKPMSGKEPAFVLAMWMLDGERDGDVL